MLMTRKQLRKHLKNVLFEVANKSGLSRSDIENGFYLDSSDSKWKIRSGLESGTKIIKAIAAGINQPNGMRDFLGPLGEDMSEYIVLKDYNPIQLNDVMGTIMRSANLSGAEPGDFPAADLGVGRWGGNTITSNDITLGGGSISVKASHESTPSSFRAHNTSTMDSLVGWCLANNVQTRQQLKLSGTEVSVGPNNHPMRTKIENYLSNKPDGFKIKCPFGLLYINYNPFKSDTFTTTTKYNLFISPITSGESIFRSGRNILNFDNLLKVNGTPKNTDNTTPRRNLAIYFNSLGYSLFSTSGAVIDWNQQVNLKNEILRYSSDGNNLNEGVEKFFLNILESLLRTFYKNMNTFANYSDIAAIKSNMNQIHWNQMADIFNQQLDPINKSIEFNGNNLKNLITETDFLDKCANVKVVEYKTKIVNNIDANFLEAEVYYYPPDNNTYTIEKTSAGIIRKWNNNLVTGDLVCPSKEDFIAGTKIATFSFSNIKGLKDIYAQFRSNDSGLLDQALAEFEIISNARAFARGLGYSSDQDTGLGIFKTSAGLSAVFTNPNIRHSTSSTTPNLIGLSRADGPFESQFTAFIDKNIDSVTLTSQLTSTNQTLNNVLALINSAPSTFEIVNVIKGLSQFLIQCGIPIRDTSSLPPPTSNLMFQFEKSKRVDKDAINKLVEDPIQSITSGNKILDSIEAHLILGNSLSEGQINTLTILLSLLNRKYYIDLKKGNRTNLKKLNIFENIRLNDSNLINEAIEYSLNLCCWALIETYCFEIKIIDNKNILNKIKSFVDNGFTTVSSLKDLTDGDEVETTDRIETGKVYDVNIMDRIPKHPPEILSDFGGEQFFKQISESKIYEKILLELIKYSK